MKDVAGNTLMVGDKVARHSAARDNTFLRLTEVMGFTPKMVVVKAVGEGNVRVYPENLVVILNGRKNTPDSQEVSR